MRASPIQLLHVIYKRVAVKEYSGEKRSQSTAVGFDFEGVNIKAKVAAGMKKGQRDDPQDFLVDLEVQIENAEGKPTPYDIDIGILGVFKVLPSLPNERREDLVTVNGASILYGAIREIVLTLTSRFAAGAMTLPGMNFEDHAPSARREKVVEELGHAAIVDGGVRSPVHRPSPKGRTRR
jgi:preprotein translocase subunit SecB